MHPVLFTFPDGLPLFGGQTIYAYGVLLGLSLIAAWYTTLWVTSKEGIDRGRAMIALGVAVSCAMLGARGLFFVTNPDAWEGIGSMAQVVSGGLVVYGGILGGILGAMVALRALGIGFWRFADCAAPQIALGIAVGRLGCWFYGCDFGQRAGGWASVRFPRWDVAHLPWAGRPCRLVPDSCGGLTWCDPNALVCVVKGSPAWALHRRLGVVDAADALSAAVHPVQLYAAGCALCLFVGLTWLFRRKRFHGQVLLAFLGGYGAVRFVLERLRGDPQRGAVWESADPGLLSSVLVMQPAPDGSVTWALTTSQFISILMIVVAISLAAVGWRRATGRPAPRIGDLGQTPEAKTAETPAPSPL